MIGAAGLILAALYGAKAAERVFRSKDEAKVGIAKATGSNHVNLTDWRQRRQLTGN